VKLTLPHWAGLALGIATIFLTWAMQQQASGQLVLPAIAVTVLVVVSKIVGLLSVSVNPAANARAAIATGAVVPASIAQRPLIPTPVDSSTEVTQPDAGTPRSP
jgi:hypothetical protein